MKKILSFVLLAALLLSCIAPALSVSAADGPFALTVPAITTVIGQKKSATVEITVADAVDGVAEIDFYAWWPVDSLDEIAFTCNGTEADVGTVRAGTHKSVKDSAPDFVEDLADWNAALVTWEADFADDDVITATFTFAEDFDYSGFTFGIVLDDVCDPDFDSYDLDVDQYAGDINFAADKNYDAVVAAAEGIDGPVFAVENVTVPVGTKTTEIRLFLIHNSPDDYDVQQTRPEWSGPAATGIWGTRTYLITPAELTVHHDDQEPAVIADYTVGDIFPGEDFKPGIAQVEIDSNNDLLDSWNATYTGTDMDKDDWRATCMYFQSRASEAGGTVLLNRYGDGMLLTLTIDLPANARAGQVFPIKIAHWVGYTVLGVFGSDTSGADNELVFPTFFDGSITIESDGTCATNHANAVWQTVTPSTCTVAGEEELYCPDCTQVLDTRALDLADHVAGDPVGAVAATCTTPGYTGDVYCTVCTNLISEGVATDLAPHTPGDKIVVTPATTTTEGAWEIKCTVCKETIDTGVIPMLVVAKISVGDVTGEPNAKISVPVKIADNEGFWAIGGTIDLGGLELTGIKKGIITLGEDNYSINDGVLTFFFDNESIANITKTGTLFTLELKGVDQDEYALDLEVFDMIDCEGNDKLFETSDGTVTIACNHVTHTEVTTAPTLDAEGVLSTICDKCGLTIAEEPIAKLVGIDVAEVEAATGDEISVPVSIINNNGVWSVGAMFTFDDDALEFVDVTSDVFAMSEDNYSVDGNVIIVFAESEGFVDYAENGEIFALNFVVADDASGEYDITAAMVTGNTINVAGDEIAAVAIDGSVKVHSHVGVLVNAVDPTFTTPGYTGDLVCEICEDLIAEGKTITVNFIKRTEGYAYYLDGVLTAAGVVTIDGNLAFVKNNGYVAMNETVKVLETATNGLVEAGTYTADADGVITPATAAKNGIVNGYYYVNDVLTAAGVIEIDGQLYFVKNNGQVAVNEEVNVYSTKTNGLVDAGKYTADANGVITAAVPAPNAGFVNGYYYIDGVLQGNIVVEDNGNLYFILGNGTKAVNRDVYVSAAKANGLVSVGYHHFDADGILSER